MKSTLLLAFAILLLTGCKKTIPKGDGSGGSAVQEAAETDDTYVIDEENPEAISILKALDHPETTTVIVLYPFELKEDGSLNSSSLPSAVWNLKRLHFLGIHCFESMESLPSQLGDLSELETLDMDGWNGCGMNLQLPETLGKLQNLRALILYGALDPDDHSNPGNTPKPLPRSLARLTGLRTLNIGRNELKEVAPQVAALRSLIDLNLSFNDLDSVPAFVGNLENLKILNVEANNHIRLPQSLARINGLEIRMGNNALSIADQDSLKLRFPKARFYFGNEFDDSRANEDSPETLASYGDSAEEPSPSDTGR